MCTRQRRAGPPTTCSGRSRCRLGERSRRQPAEMTRPAIGTFLAVALALLTLAPASARADGDPASDVLLGENVFYPYESPSVSASLMRTLNGATAAADKAHFP